MTVGQRLKRFRTRKGLTQKQLGLAVGFDNRTADIRIAQYETGTRKPKDKYIEKLAAIVGVQPSALEVPEIKNYEHLFQLLFALEDEYGLKISKDEHGTPCLVPDIYSSSSHCDTFRAWYKKSEQLKNGEITQEQYDNWRYQYPASSARETHEALKTLRQKKKEDGEI
ncbi:hypothetical protein IMSAG250_01154 [Clostridiales bacterium]|nr:hypothetical protein IMSAG250_01154 [Clostridiales bacterium]